jgi:hypothetical protein
LRPVFDDFDLLVVHEYAMLSNFVAKKLNLLLEEGAFGEFSVQLVLPQYV